MTRQEFTDRTNYTPSWNEFETIHDNYMEFNGDKDQFCRLWKKVNAATIKEQVLTKKDIELLTSKRNEMIELGRNAARLEDRRMEDYYYECANKLNRRIKEKCELINM